MGRLGDHLLDFSNSDRESEHVVRIQCNSSDGGTYECSIGHCCDKNQCCSHYYELWWFWLIWSAAILFSCCCLYHQRQKRYQQTHRNRNRRRRRRRHKETYEGVCNYPGPPLENKILGSTKLPGYKDVIRIPPTSSPPPPYSSRRRSIHTIACLQPNYRGETSMSIIHCNITSSMLSVASLSHYVPELLAQNSIQPLLPSAGGEHEAMDDNNNTEYKVMNERGERSHSLKTSFCEDCDDYQRSTLFQDPKAEDLNNNIPSIKFSPSNSHSSSHSPNELCVDPSSHLLRHYKESND